MQEMKIRVVLLTGDTRAVAEAVGDQLGMLQVEAGLLPEEKTRLVAPQVKKGKVAMLAMASMTLRP